MGRSCQSKLVGRENVPTAAIQDKLASNAWRSRRHALIYGTTSVGCAVMDESGRIYTGCNVEHRFRSHDIHAETNALGSMVAGGGEKVVALFVVSPKGWAPCGSCLDWIFELGGKDCAIFTQSELDGLIGAYRAVDLLPHFPEHAKPRQTAS
ncbi:MULTISPECIES: cytidine deaminase [unclassified Streptomyces]|uniref:cytidine deaminase family protein n=1 Tax=unclassified Streptomyces TaxID=2593676 RepID=UPI0035DA6AEB